MDKEQVLTRIKDVGVVAVVRAENSDQAKRITDACIEGGIAAIEMTFTVPGAHKVIEELAKTYTSDQIILGAGTVMDPETARIAILSGAEYIVSPYLNLNTIKLCNRYRLPCMPGVMSITEAVTAMEAGADIIKLFPGEAFGPKMIKAIKGPIPYAKIMPTGGVSVDNVDQWIKNGASAVGVGGALTAGAKTGDYKSITEIGKQFIEKVKAARA
ncbi:MAG: bifunctional 2-keto-4-hydroxyglutarate aldolase/2-keto-3-deoxy-6-phosphogluconate aldolase [Clostridia bacterium]|nr:bifunctional 2-keto-4-hydroxyglutarate aldolase/2-keto-3-deoxy-6-phosphogluconate aldolase [Clostridia bacterium]